MKELRPTLVLFVLLTLVTGVAYPMMITGIAKVTFPDKARGSLIERSGHAVGSELIGQPFASAGYFWGRPSATSAFPYDAAASTGSNLGPINPALAELVASRRAALLEADPENPFPVPVELVTASGSGLDPHISPAAARYQLRRVARASGLPENEVSRLVDAHTERRTLGLFGEARVNVLMLNLALADLRARPTGEGKP